MNPLSPEPPGAGFLYLHTDGRKSTNVEYKGNGLVFAHLFYCALIEIPNCHEAILMALERYNQDKPGQHEIQQNPII